MAQDDVTKYQEMLEGLLCNDPASIKKKIDQSHILKQTTSYWNDSVKNLLKNLTDFFSDFYDDEKYIEHNAAHSFSDIKDYVKPNKNKLGEYFLEARDDENIDVLQNSSNLNFTINENQDSEGKIIEYMSKLLMACYVRNVEIEDLNRNFWVIGQNLTILNKFVLELNNNFLKDLIAELTGIWDNIYRIWQAIYYIDQKIEDNNFNEKVHVIINCNKILNHASHAAKIGNTLPISSFVNEYISSINWENMSQQELINIFCNKKNNPIFFETNLINRDIKEIIKNIEEKNFAFLKITTSSFNEPLWHLFSLSFTSDSLINICPKAKKKTIKAENLWITFKWEGDESFITYNQNNFGNLSSLLDYDIDLGIPFKIYKGLKRYEDVIRINKPFPHIGALTLRNSYIYLLSFLNDANYIAYGDTFSTGDFYCLDGFYGFNWYDSINNYPPKTQNGIFVTTTSEFYSNGLPIQNCYKTKFSSSDLISFEHPTLGQTDYQNFYNDYFDAKISNINLRYIPGRDNSQDIEIISPKDFTPDKILKIEPTITPLRVKVGYIRFKDYQYDSTNQSKTGIPYLKIIANDSAKIESTPYDVSRSVAIKNAKEFYPDVENNTRNFYSINLNDNNNKDKVCLNKNGTLFNILDANKIDTFSIGGITVKSIIEGRLKEKFKNIDRYDYKFIITYYEAFSDAFNRNVGSHNSALYMVFKDSTNKIKTIQLGIYDYSLSFFNGSSLNEAAQLKTIWNPNTKKYEQASIINAYYPFYDGNWHGTTGAYLTDINISGDYDNPDINIGKFCFTFSGHDLMYEIWGSIKKKDNKYKWSKEGSRNRGLQNYSYSDGELQNYNYSDWNTDNFFYAIRDSEAENVIVKQDNSGRLLNLEPWSNTGDHPYSEW